MRQILASTLMLLLSLGLYAQQLKPNPDQSHVTFEIKNFGSTVDGSFKGLNGNIIFNESDISKSKFDVSIDTKTIDTDIGMRDKHLRKEEYFHVDAFPTIRFVSTKIVSSKPGQGTVTGKLTIKKTTKEITFPFTYSLINGKPTFSGTFKLNRREYDVGGNSFSLADDLTVFLEVKTL